MDTNSFPQILTFYHKLLRDWLTNHYATTEYYIDESEGIDLNFSYLIRSFTKHQKLPYSLLKHWKYYGKSSRNYSLFETISNDINFIMELIKQERQHSDFDTAFSTINNILILNEKQNFLWYNMQLALNDIYIDLDDKRMFSSLNILLNNVNLIPTNSFYSLIHLYENAGWIFMIEKDYTKSNTYYSLAIETYNSIPISLSKKEKFAHTLYLYSISLYRQKNFSDSRKKLELSQALISETVNQHKSLDYSLGLKMMGWIESKTKNYHKAEQYFLEALDIQKSILNDTNTFLAHTYYCLSKIEIQLYGETHDTTTYKKILYYIKKAKDIYCQYDLSYQNMLSHLENIENKLISNEKRLIKSKVSGR